MCSKELQVNKDSKKYIISSFLLRNSLYLRFTFPPKQQITEAEHRITFGNTMLSFFQLYPPFQFCDKFYIFEFQLRKIQTPTENVNFQTLLIFCSYLFNKVSIYININFYYIKLLHIHSHLHT